MNTSYGATAGRGAKLGRLLYELSYRHSCDFRRYSPAVVYCPPLSHRVRFDRLAALPELERRRRATAAARCTIPRRVPSARQSFEPRSTFPPPEHMQPFASFRARGAVFAAIVVALSACDDPNNLNSPSPRARLQDVQALDTSSALVISDLSLSSKTILIGGPLVTYTATIFSSTRSFSGLTVRSYFVQNQIRHQVGDQGIPCAFGSATCTYTNPIQTLGVVPGPAQFELQLLDATGVVRSTRDVGVTLVAPQTINSVILRSNTLVVGGPLVSDSMTLVNQGPSVSGVAIQGWLVQSGANNARRATGGSAVQCGSGSGILPNGVCSLFSVIAASNTSAGTGTLISGAATFELDLTVNGTVVSQLTVPVSIMTGASITGLSLAPGTSDTLLLEGSSAAYTTTLRNTGASLSGISIQGWISQGTARRFAGGRPVSCGSSSGVLPNGSCTVSSQVAASNNTAGSGTLSTGTATFELQLVDGTGTVLGSATILLYVVDGPLESPPVGPSADGIVVAKKARIPSP